MNELIYFPSLFYSLYYKMNLGIGSLSPSVLLIINSWIGGQNILNWMSDQSDFTGEKSLNFNSPIKNGY